MQQTLRKTPRGEQGKGWGYTSSNVRLRGANSGRRNVHKLSSCSLVSWCLFSWKILCLSFKPLFFFPVKNVPFLFHSYFFWEENQCIFQLFEIRLLQSRMLYKNVNFFLNLIPFLISCSIFMVFCNLFSHFYFDFMYFFDIFFLLLPLVFFHK